MFLEQELYHNTIQQWLLALLVLMASFIVLRIILKLIYQRFKKFTQQTENYIDDMLADLLARIKLFVLFFIALYFASLLLEIPPIVAVIMNKLVIIAIVIQAAIWGNSLISFWIIHFKAQKMQVDAAGVTTFNAIGLIGRIILWFVVFLLVLDNLGIDITALVAGLGIGGIAIALAVQNILGDLIASFSIVFDKPFVIGDFIVIDTHMGTVEHIGIKTTRIRSLSGEQMIFSNNDLLQSRIKNYKRMQERRVVFTIGVTYDTSVDKLNKIPGLITEIIKAQENTRFDRAHFKEFGDFALLFEVVYWVLVPDYNTYMDLQQKINFQVFNKFQQEKIEFAFPTQTIYVNNNADSSNKN